MSPNKANDQEGRDGAPRVSGDEPASVLDAVNATLCSPRERG